MSRIEGESPYTFNPSAYPQVRSAGNYTQPSSKYQSVAATLTTVPEIQWAQISSARVKLNPDAKVDPLKKEPFKKTPLFQRIFDKSLTFFPKSPQQEYREHLQKAENALALNMVMRGEFYEDDLISFNKALSLVTPSERAPLNVKLAHAHTLRHLPEERFTHALNDQLITGKNQEIATDKFNAEMAIMSTKEAIESYLSKLIDQYSTVGGLLETLKQQTAKSPKRVEALNTIHQSLKLILECISDKAPVSSSALEAIAKQIDLLDDQNAYPALTSILRNNLEILADLYFMEATEYERMASITAVMPHQNGSFLNLSSNECRTAALSGYRTAAALLQEQLEQSKFLEERIKTRIFVKTGNWDENLDNHEEVHKLREQRAALEGALMRAITALVRLETANRGRHPERSYLPEASAPSMFL
jgi:hypothetical protein